MMEENVCVRITICGGYDGHQFYFIICGYSNYYFVGVITGKRTKNHLRLSTVYGFKGMFYLYSAIANLFYYIKQNGSEKYVIGFAVGLAIIEGTNGIFECYEESLKNAKERQGIKEIK